MKTLSQGLAELSAQAKNAEDRIATAQSEVRERVEQKRDEVRGEVEQALGKVQQRFAEAKGEARTRFDALHAKVNSDFEQMKQKASEAKRKFESWQAENYASDTEDDALAAIDYAVAATKMAELATLDAIAARTRTETLIEQRPAVA